MTGSIDITAVWIAQRLLRQNNGPLENCAGVEENFSPCQTVCTLLHTERSEIVGTNTALTPKRITRVERHRCSCNLSQSAITHTIETVKRKSSLSDGVSREPTLEKTSGAGTGEMNKPQDDGAEEKKSQGQ